MCRELSVISIRADTPMLPRQGPDMKLLVACVASIAMAGCCMQQQKPSSPMTLDKAVTQIREGLAKARSDCTAHPDDCKSGLMVSGAEVTLTLSQSIDNKLEVALPVGVSTITGGISST